MKEGQSWPIEGAQHSRQMEASWKGPEAGSILMSEKLQGCWDVVGVQKTRGRLALGGQEGSVRSCLCGEDFGSQTKSSWGREEF